MSGGEGWILVLIKLNFKEPQSTPRHVLEEEVGMGLEEY